MHAKKNTIIDRSINTKKMSLLFPGDASFMLTNN